MPCLSEIELATKAFADAHEELTRIVGELNDEIHRVKRARISAIRKAVAKTAERRGTLAALIEAGPDLFTKPRTCIFHGIKVGIQKQKGAVEWQDSDQVVELIKKHFPDLTGDLIRVKEMPNKDALADLRVSDLKRIACSIVESADEVIIKPTDSEVDKIVSALLADAAVQE